MDSLPIIFTHYGNSEYLKYTLQQARISNPQKECILIGDSTNEGIAIECGWKHIRFRALLSSRRDEFNSYFCWVQGSIHNPVKGGKDWLRYVFERFFILEVFLAQQKIDCFWHFDTDTMIIGNLQDYEIDLINSPILCTTLCNGTCPSGFIRQEFIQMFCSRIINDFKDQNFLDSQQHEFDTLNPHFAFTEMRSFEYFAQNFKSNKIPQLSDFFISKNVWFDDCICQSHDFEVCRVPLLGFKKIKNLYSSPEGVFCLNQELNKPFKFVTVNCSWVPLEVFAWIADITNERERESRSRYLKHYLYFGILRTSELKHFLSTLLIYFAKVIIKLAKKIK